MALVVMCVLFAFTVVGNAAVKQWSGIAENDILIKDTITNITSGVTEHEVITNVSTGDDQKIDYVCEINPVDTVKVVAGYGKDNADSWSLTRTTAQAAAYEKNHPGETVVAAINADFFNMATGEPMGALVMEGEKKHDSNGRYYFGVKKDGTPVIRNTADLSDLSMAVGGDALLVENGQVVEESSSYGELKYSRTAIGFKEDGTIVTFVTYGKRPPVSCGRTYEEMAQMFAKAGCVYALALDGGGSSTWAGRPEGTDKLVVRNSPNDGAEREVSSSILIVSTAEPTGVFDHAKLTPNNEVYTPKSEVKFEADGVDTAGFSVELPEGTKFALADDSKELGEINAETGLFKAGDKTGVVNVNLTKDGEVIGQTSIEIAVPDKIYFANEEISLGFEEESNLGIVVRSKERDIHIKNGDIVWERSDESMGSFSGNTFKSSSENSVTGVVTAKSAYDDSVSGSITVIVGKLPTLVWDFEDVTDEEGNTISAEDYYIGDSENPGILTHSNYNRGGKESIEIADLNREEPVRFGAKSLKLNYDFTECGEVTEGACIGTTEGFTVPGTPTAIGVWVYAPEGVGITYEGEGSQAGFWLRGYVMSNGNYTPYDFTLEPKALKPGDQPGIYWEGWKYLEADLTKLPAPYTIAPKMTFRLMFVHGTKMGTRTANSIYFDNFQFVYGTNIDDVDEPVIDAITIDGKQIDKDTVVEKDKVSIDAIVSDVDGKYATGIDAKTVRMYIDGENVVNNDKYQFVYDASGQMAHLYDVKLSDGKHSVTLTIRDGFGNETSETRYFVVNTGGAVEKTRVSVEPAEESAMLGKTINLQIKASDDTVTDSTTAIKLGNMFPDYTVSFSDNYDGTESFSKVTKTVTIKAKRKEGENPVDDGNVIATLSVKVPPTLKEDDVFSYTIKNGKFETALGEYDTYSSEEITIPVGAEYSISAEPVIIGGEDAVIKVVNSNGEAASGVSVYLAEDDSLLGKTDEDGKLTTDKFNAASGSYPVYAKDDEGALSFQYKVRTYDPQGEENNMPQSVRFNAVSDSKTQKNITWTSNPLSEGKQVVKYAVSGSDDWTEVEASSTRQTFVTGGNKVADINSVILKGLTPDTTYEYIVGSEGAFTEKATFKTDAKGRTDTEFFVIGDIQNPDKTNLEAIIDKLKADGKKYDFGIQTGDAVDNGADYADWSSVGQLLGAGKLGSVDMLSIMGNHEYYGDSEGKVAAAMYNNPNTGEGACYSVEYGNIYIATVNFANNSSQIKAAAEWLKKDAAESNAAWKILCSHQPPYFTNSTGGNDPVYEYMPDAIEEAGINIVFSGHDHSFARTNPLIDDKKDEENGIIYYVCGSTGGKVYPITTKDKFDYDEIFKYVSTDYIATYLTASVSKDEMTVNMYDLSAGLIDTVTIKSSCIRNNHSGVYNPETNTLVCRHCGQEMENYTGEVRDSEGNRYYLLKGIMQTGWVTIGEDFLYFGKDGIKEKVTAEIVEKTCVIDTVVTYTSESGAVKVHRFNDAGGHEYEEQDGRWICTVCGYERVNMEDCKYELDYTKCTYSGIARKPLIGVTAPNGDKLVYGTARDYTVEYINNVDVGKATMKFTASRYGKYVNINDWRGNCKGTYEVDFTIHPDAPNNVIAAYQTDKVNLSWNSAKQADQYIVYKSIDGKDWSYVGITKDTKYTVKGLKSPQKYKFRVYSKKKGTDGKEYKSLQYASAKYLKVSATISNDVRSGSPVLKWSTSEGVSYTVYRATNKYGTYSKMYTTKGGSYKNTSAVAGKTYYYKIKSVLTKSNISAMSQIYTCAAKCAQPQTTALHRMVDGKPILKWGKVKGAVKYEVYRSGSGKNGTYSKIASVKTTYVTNTTAAKGKSYYYIVRAIASNGVKSSFSTKKQITCIYIRPELTAKNNEGKLTMNWSSVKGAAKYEVYRSVSGKTGTFERIYTTKYRQYTDTSVRNGKTYYYKVRAVSEAGLKGDFSKMVTVKVVE